MKRKLLSLALALVMVFTFVPTVSLAADIAPVELVIGHTNGEVTEADVKSAGEAAGFYNSNSGWNDTLFFATFIPGVTKIGYNAFNSCKSLTGVTIPDGVNIDRWAFFGCTSLSSVRLPNGITTIGYNTFANCTSLTSMIIPDSVTTIDCYAFGGDSTTIKELWFLGDAPNIYIGNYPALPNQPDLIIYYLEGKVGWTTPTWTPPNTSLTYNTVLYEGVPNPDSKPTPEPIKAPNLDTANIWAQTGIQEAFDKGFIPEDIQNNYKNIITRTEFCRMAVKWLEYSLGKNIDTILSEKGLTRNPNAFSDTSDPDILAAFALGITSGTKAPTDTTSGTFTPDGEFNREQAATMIRNTCKASGMDVSKVTNAGFNDIGTASTWAVDGINFVRNAGIMQGTGNDNYGPKATYTREQSIITFNNIK